MKDAKEVAKVIALHCVRNTCIENFHAKGQLSQADMCEFNKEVVNKIYSLLCLEIRNAGIPAWIFTPPSGWDEPKLDDEFALIFDKLKVSKEGL